MYQNKNAKRFPMKIVETCPKRNVDQWMNNNVQILPNKFQGKMLLPVSYVFTSGFTNISKLYFFTYICSQDCKKIQKQNCKAIPTEICQDFTTTLCRQVPEEKTTNVCRKIPERVCKSKPQEICNLINVPNCIEDIVEKCQEKCENIYWCKVCSNV